MRFVKNHTDSAEERYLEFIHTYPNLEQYVAQKYIASYLGITPEFLSKVRKNLSRK
jgi:Mn-dependent DtxR family transcriptional regulator